MASDGVTQAIQYDVPEQKSSFSTASLPKEKQDVSHGDAEIDDVDGNADEDVPSTWLARNRGLVRRVKLFALAAVIFAWWISSTVLRATRHRWIVQTFFAWSFIAIIAFRFIPNSVVTRPVEAVWIPLVQRPFFTLPKHVRHGLGWLALVAIVMGSAFGFKLENVGLSACVKTVVNVHLLTPRLWRLGHELR
jgi:CNT family concentrative nucleoside transporter